MNRLLRRRRRRWTCFGIGNRNGRAAASCRAQNNFRVFSFFFELWSTSINQICAHFLLPILPTYLDDFLPRARVPCMSIADAQKVKWTKRYAFHDNILFKLQTNRFQLNLSRFLWPVLFIFFFSFSLFSPSQVSSSAKWARKSLNGEDVQCSCYVDVSCEKRSHSEYGFVYWRAGFLVQTPSSSVEHAMRALPGSDSDKAEKRMCSFTYCRHVGTQPISSLMWYGRVRASAYSQFPSLTSFSDSARKHELRFGNEFFGSSDGDGGNGDLIMHASLADSEMGERLKFVAIRATSVANCATKFPFLHSTFANLKHVCRTTLTKCRPQSDKNKVARSKYC